MKKLPDEIAACNLIKRERKYHKKFKYKCIIIPLDINDVNISNKMTLHYNPSTEHIDISPHGIGYKTICIYPTTKQKLKCTNPHALEYLEMHRASARIKIKSKNKRFH